jgi:hypothetical protein
LQGVDDQFRADMVRRKHSFGEVSRLPSGRHRARYVAPGVGRAPAWVSALVGSDPPRGSTPAPCR